MSLDPKNNQNFWDGSLTLSTGTRSILGDLRGDFLGETSGEMDLRLDVCG